MTFRIIRGENMSEYLDTLMNLLLSDSTLVNNIDNIVAEAPREDADLEGTNQTIMALYDSAKIEDRFLSQYRDVQKSDIIIKIEILSSKGNNSAYCDLVVAYLVSKFEMLSTISDIGWRLHINSIDADTLPVQPGRWRGLVTLTCQLFYDI